MEPVPSAVQGLPSSSEKGKGAKAKKRTQGSSVQPKASPDLSGSAPADQSKKADRNGQQETGKKRQPTHLQKVGWYSHPSPAMKVSSADHRAVVIAAHNAIPVEVWPVVPNNHVVAAMFRQRGRAVEADLLIKELNEQSEDLMADVTILFPSEPEYKFFQSALYKRTGVKNGETRKVVIERYREKLSSNDSARARTYVGGVLTSSRLFLANDCLYHFSPAELVAMFAESPFVRQGGVVIFGMLRHLPSEEGSLVLERYRYAACERTELPPLVGRAKGNGSVPAGEEPLKPEGLERLPEVDIVEGVGWFHDGSAEFHSSVHRADAVYSHVVKCNDLFSITREIFWFEGSSYALSVHVERKLGPYVILRIHVEAVSDGRLFSEPRHRCIRDWLVLDGIIPGVVDEMIPNSAQYDVESPASLAGAYTRAWAVLMRLVGAHHYASLARFMRGLRDPYLGQLLVWALNNSVHKSISVARSIVYLPLPGVGLQELALQHAADRLARQTTLPREAAVSLARVTQKSTYGDLVANVFGEMSRLVRSLWASVGQGWDWFLGFFFVEEASELSFFSSAGKALASTMRHFPAAKRVLRRFRRWMHAPEGLRVVQRWVQSKPVAAWWLDKIVVFSVCLFEAYWEELIKRYGPSGWSALFGLLEVYLDWVCGKGVSIDLIGLIRALTIQAITQWILRLLPILPAVLIHALINFIRRRKTWVNLLGVVADVAEMQIDLSDLEELRTLSQVETISISRVDPEIIAAGLASMPLKIAHRGADLQVVNLGPEFALDEVLPQSRRIKLVTGDNTLSLMVRPTNTHQQMLLMLQKRFLIEPKYEPNGSFMDRCVKLLMRVIIRPLTRNGLTRVPLWTWGEVRRYVEERDWPTAKRDTYLEEIGRHERGEYIKASNAMMNKQDEILPCKLEYSLSYPTAKTRPVIPKNVASIPAMRYVHPVREFLSAETLFLVPGGARGVELLEGLPSSTDVTMSFTYVARPNAEVLSNMFSRLSVYVGMHFLLHGDDCIVLRTDGVDVFAAAFDLVTCDLSAREAFQDGYIELMSGLVSDGVRDILLTLKKQLSGSYHFTTCGVPFVFTKKEVSTNTGEMATALKAFVMQLLAGVATASAVSRHGRFQFDLFFSEFMRVNHELGFDPEPELGHGCVDGCFFPVSAVSFLGGRFYQSSGGHNRYIWNSDKALKLLAFPDVQSIYNVDVGVGIRMHMAAIVEDPDFESNPMLRPIASWFRRVLEQSPVDAQLAMGAWRAYRVRKESYRLDLESHYCPPFLSDVDFLDGVQQLLSRLHDPIDGFIPSAVGLFEDHCLTFSDEDGPLIVGKGKLLLAYVMRFQKIPAWVFGPSFDHIELSLTFRVCQLGLKIVPFLERMIKSKKETKKKVAKEVEKDLKKLEKHEACAPARTAPKGQRRAGPSAAPTVQLNHKATVTPSDAGVLAYVHSVCEASAAPQAPPPLIGVGQQGAPPRMLVNDATIHLVANNDGFCCCLLMPCGWVPDQEVEQSVPANATIGGTNAVTAGVINRGAFAVYTDAGWQPGGIDNFRVPVEGTALYVNPPSGVHPVSFPPTFVANQDPVDTSGAASVDSRQTFQLTHLSASIVPDGYQTSAQVSAVNVVSGDIMAFTMTSGDDNSYNPSSEASQGVDSYTWLSQIPKANNIVQTMQASVAEWKRGDELTTFCVPDTSTALGAWPPMILTTDNTGAPSAVLTRVISGVRAGFIVAGAQAGQKFKVQIHVAVAAFGTETFEPSRAAVHRKPVDSSHLDDVLSRTLSMHAKPVVKPEGSAINNGARAFAQHKSDTGTPKSQIASVVKATAQVAEAATGVDSVADILGEIGGIVGALFL